MTTSSTARTPNSSAKPPPNNLHHQLSFKSEPVHDHLAKHGCFGGLPGPSRKAFIALQMPSSSRLLAGPIAGTDAQRSLAEGETKRHQDLREGARNTARSVLSCKSLYQGTKFHAPLLRMTTSSTARTPNSSAKPPPNNLHHQLSFKSEPVHDTLVNISCFGGLPGSSRKAFIALQMPSSSRLLAGPIAGTDAQRSLTEGETKRHQDLQEGARNTARSVLSCKSLYQGTKFHAPLLRMTTSSTARTPNSSAKPPPNNLHHQLSFKSEPVHDTLVNMDALVAFRGPPDRRSLPFRCPLLRVCWLDRLLAQTLKEASPKARQKDIRTSGKGHETPPAACFPANRCIKVPNFMHHSCE